MERFGGFAVPGLDLLGLGRARDEPRPCAEAAAGVGEADAGAAALSGSGGSIDDLLDLLPRHLLISPTLSAGADEGGNEDARRDAPAHRAADRLAAAPLPMAGAGLLLTRGADAGGAFATAFGKPLSVQARPSIPGSVSMGVEGGGSGAACEPAMSLETQRVVAYLSARGRMALAAAAAASDFGQPHGCPAGAPPRSPPAAALPGLCQPLGPLPAGFPEADQLHVGAPPLGSWPPAAGSASQARDQQLLRGLRPLPPPARPFDQPNSNAAAAMAMAAWGWAAAAGVGLPPPPIGFLGSNGGRGPFPAMPRGAGHEASGGLPPLFPGGCAGIGLAASGRGGAVGAGAGEPAIAGARAAALAASTPGPPPPAPPPPISRNLWLGNVMIPNAEVLTTIFRRFGPIESVRVFTGRTYAFVNYMCEAHAATAKASLEMQVIPELTSAAPLLVRFQQPPEGYRARSTPISHFAGPGGEGPGGLTM
ncbi:hypothetical protein Rsub_01742 [Raphidocelis subcapitata]|uniref:RRM domain-containing protein n=1 Tax=Raphidocelis subcapitata TaxID=307507 RepID=A0A2V0NMT2_9CHLO|nr:hypothetical protein Rsub_01742 [Raphidocelis subcapitata]|eukprot:GBF88841.1 hypothetical protein Rsub_01742 [Raphidocelis subcapitata]